MDKQTLRAMQKPLKERFSEDPSSAQQVLTAHAVVSDSSVSCQVDSFLGSVPCGLHELTGGDGSEACSADMMLQSLVGCAGVTLKAVALAMEIEMRSAKVIAEGTLDFRGTLGLDRDVPVGFKSVTMKFELDTPAEQESVEKLIELTERYCVVFQSLKLPTDTRSVLVRV